MGRWREFGLCEAAALVLAVCAGALRHCSALEEPFVFYSVLIAMVASLTFALRGQRINPTWPVPLFSAMHTAYWTLQYAYCCFHASAEQAVLVHTRVNEQCQWELFACMWMVLGFLAGIQPGRGLHKFMLLAISTVVVVGRLRLLEQAWERACSEPAWENRPERKACAAAGGAGSIELMAGGIKCLVTVPTLALTLGIYARSKMDEHLHETEDYYSAEVAKLRSQATELEHARREALVRERQLGLRRRGLGKGRAQSSLLGSYGPSSPFRPVQEAGADTLSDKWSDTAES